MPKAFDWFSRMIAQCGNTAKLTKQLMKALQLYPTVFQIFGKTHEEINISIKRNTK